jgi:hypothetical protein
MRNDGERQVKTRDKKQKQEGKKQFKAGFGHF